MECLLCVLCVLCCWVLATFSFSPVVYTSSDCLLWAVIGLWLGGMHFNRMCTSLLEKWDPVPLPPEPRPHRRCRFGRLSAGKVWDCFLGEGTHSASMSQAWLERADPLKHVGAGFGLSKLGGECGHCAGFHRWLCLHCAYEGWGREMGCASTFLPGGASLWCLSLQDRLYDEKITFLPTRPRQFSNCCFHAVPTLAACHAVSLRAGPSFLVLSGLS